MIVDKLMMLSRGSGLLSRGKHVTMRGLRPSRLYSALSGFVPLHGTFKLPETHNEPMKSFAPGSLERELLTKALHEMKNQPMAEIPLIINGQKIQSHRKAKQTIGCDHASSLCEYSVAESKHVAQAIKGTLEAKMRWEAMPLAEKCAIFLRAAELLTSPKYRYRVMAATMWGQGKTIWQAEIDAIAELADFWRFNCLYAQHIYADQPPKNSQGIWNRVEYRPLEGFVFAVSPFNFTAIGGNLACAPALMGNVVVWKPSASAIYSNYLVYEILIEAGLPPGVIQFLPGEAESMSHQIFEHPDFAGLHFTGSTSVFKGLWKKIGANMHVYKSYPRIVGETGGKNMHFIHESADPNLVIHQTIRAAYENQGQKCSACSRIYVPDNLWPQIKDGLIKETKAISVGQVNEFKNFMSAVINKSAFDKCVDYIEWAKQSKDVDILVGGTYDGSKGYYIHPTVLLANDPHVKTMEEEIFGPIVTVFVYPAKEYEKYLGIANNTSGYGLTASVFAKSREAIMTGLSVLRHSAGNMYINDKCTGAVVGQQPFGGGRNSGTNDKAGSSLNLLRWVSPRTIKESLVPLDHWSYPSCLE